MDKKRLEQRIRDYVGEECIGPEDNVDITIEGLVSLIQHFQKESSKTCYQNSSGRFIKVAAKNDLEATYKVAVAYSVDHFFPPTPKDGEALFEVNISAKQIF